MGSPDAVKKILTWYAKHGRDLPWRKTRCTMNPYAVLVSEVMLQQTQVDRVVPKYLAWLKEFPSWAALARAPRSRVLAFWSGLGYNNRAVRLQTLAKLLVAEYGGKLPREECVLRKLPGIGPYTAGAIKVFAHNEVGYAVDVNVERVISRLFFTKRQRVTKEQLNEAFFTSFPAGRAREWGNALMDFGSAVCTATAPACDSCPAHGACKSHGERPEERAGREKKRQSTFLGSNRWWRGRILATLNTHPSLSERALGQKIKKAMGTEDTAAFKKALAQLRKEGLVAPGRSIRIQD